MTRLLAVSVSAALALCVVIAAYADPGDGASLSLTSARIGDRVVLHLDVAAAQDAQVEVLPGGAQWNGVEVIESGNDAVRTSGGSSIHRLDITVAAFSPGDVSFRPVVSIAQGTETSIRELPPVTLHVVPTLAPGDKLELSPMAPPESIGGGQSPWLLPAITLGFASVLAVAGLGAAFAVSRLRNRPSSPQPAAPPEELPGLARAEQLLLMDDPVAGYRSMATTVRSVLAERYDIPAVALTTGELRRRMESLGVDRWEARLVGGLLEECDAVVYAGYRPAGERLTADLTMAREIVERAAPAPVGA